MSNSLRVVCLLTLCTLIAFSGTFFTPQTSAKNANCKHVNGHAVWTLIPATNDPFGRVLGPSTGNLKGAVTTFLTSFTPQPDGSIHATSSDVWVVGAQDILAFSGSTTLTPIPSQPLGTVSESSVLTVVGGTGDFAGATGTLQVTGTGFNIFGPNAGLGNTYFEVSYEGEICTN